MRLESLPDFLELRIASFGPDGDVRLEAQAAAGEFGGAATCWVESAALQAFAASLEDLASNGKVEEARLESISPGELVVRVTRATLRGTFRVEFELRRLAVSRAVLGGEFEDVPTAQLDACLRWARSPRVAA